MLFSGKRVIKAGIMERLICFANFPDPIECRKTVRNENDLIFLTIVLWVNLLLFGWGRQCCNQKQRQCHSSQAYSQYNNHYDHRRKKCSINHRGLTSHKWGELFFKSIYCLYFKYNLCLITGFSSSSIVQQ